MNNIKTLLGFGALAILATGSAQALPAPDSLDAPQIAVRYDDLNLATAAGKDALHARIDGAVRKVCAVDGPRSLEGSLDNLRCIHSAHRDTSLAEARALGTSDTKMAEAQRPSPRGSE